jgi:hypothetical protein
MSLPRAKSVGEYVERVRQSVFEVVDLRECLELELEDLTRFPAFLDPLREGTYSFGREDLPFMDLAAKYSEQIPLHTLLKQINETHRRGLEVEGGNG